MAGRLPMATLPYDDLVSARCWQSATGISQCCATRPGAPPGIGPLASNTRSTSPMKTNVLFSLAILALAPAASAASLYGVTTDNHLVQFDSSNPSTFNSSF